MPRGLRPRRLAWRIGGLVVAALGAVLVGPASPAAARQPDPPQPTNGIVKCTVEAGTPPVSQPTASASPPTAVPPIVVCTVEVPVSMPVVVNDPATEMLYLGIAAGLGAALAAGATAARMRRRPPPPSGPIDGFLVGAHDLIDLTDMVQSRAAP
jgi:hypothetical protein